MDANIETVVFLDANDIAFGAFQGTVDDTELVALDKLGIVIVVKVEAFNA